MVHDLIPRSDNTSAKPIEAKDFEKLFGCHLNAFTFTGITVTDSAGCSRSVDISTGIVRLEGLYLNNTVADAHVLAGCGAGTRKMYIVLCRDAQCEPESWSYTSTTCCAAAPADSHFIADVVLDACNEVTSVCQTEMNLTSGTCNKALFGNGADGNLTVMCGCCTTVCVTKYYCNLTIESGGCFSGCEPLTVFVKNTLTINCMGSLQMNGKGAAGGVAAATGPSAGGIGAPSPPVGGNGQPGGTASSQACAGTTGVAGVAGVLQPLRGGGPNPWRDSSRRRH